MVLGEGEVIDWGYSGWRPFKRDSVLDVFLTPDIRSSLSLEPFPGHLFQILLTLSPGRLWRRWIS